MKPEDIRSTFGADQRDKYGNIKATISNILQIMENSEQYDGIKFNEMSTKAEVHGKDGVFLWSDADEAHSMNYIEEKFSIYSREKHTAALRILFDRRKYNPIKDMIESVKWDGKDRCALYLTTFGCIEDTPYTREVSRLIFAGGIHRLYHPGCKFEDVPILMGEQGCGKSSLIEFLAINKDFHGEVKQMEGTQAIEDLQGKWIMEIPEMSAFTKAKDQEAIKAFISRQRDQYRKPYDRNPTDLPRRCIFLATANDFNPLVDKTGNRRWYPVACHGDRKFGYDLFHNKPEITAYALQCWAEALVKIDSEEMQPFASSKYLAEYQKAQEDAMQDDWRVGAIREYLDRKAPGELVCVREIYHRALSPSADFPKEPTLVESKDCAKILDRLKDWERVGNKRIANYGQQKCWKKKGEQVITDDYPFM